MGCMIIIAQHQSLWPEDTGILWLRLLLDVRPNPGEIKLKENPVYWILICLHIFINSAFINAVCLLCTKTLCFPAKVNVEVEVIVCRTPTMLFEYLMLLLSGTWPSHHPYTPCSPTSTLGTLGSSSRLKLPSSTPSHTSQKPGIFCNLSALACTNFSNYFHTPVYYVVLNIATINTIHHTDNVSTIYNTTYYTKNIYRNVCMVSSHVSTRTLDLI